MNTLGRCQSLFDAYQKADCAEVWDVHVDEQLPSKLSAASYADKVPVHLTDWMNVSYSLRPQT